MHSAQVVPGAPRVETDEYRRLQLPQADGEQLGWRADSVDGDVCDCGDVVYVVMRWWSVCEGKFCTARKN